MDEIYLPALLKCELFNNIGKDELKSLLTCLKPLVQTYPKNTIVVRNGDSLDSLGIVLKYHARFLRIVYRETGFYLKISARARCLRDCSFCTSK